MKKSKHTSSRYNILVFSWCVLGFVFILSMHFRSSFQKLSDQKSEPVQPCASQTNPGQADSFIAIALENTHHQAPIHILLIGQDRRDTEPRSRSDCMILCTFRPDNNSLILTSFLRDLYVNIPGYQRNRLNAAYAFGGTNLIRQTFQENFGISVDGCVEVDFGQFSQLIDLMGGITIELRTDEAEHINYEVPGSALSSGMQHLNGAEALAYSRIRSLDEDGDFSRTNRQRTILTALLKRCQNATVSEMIRLFRNASPLLSTDIEKGQFLSLIKKLSPMLSRMEVLSQRIPAAGTYSHRIIDGMAVLDADLDAARKILQENFLGE